VVSARAHALHEDAFTRDVPAVLALLSCVLYNCAAPVQPLRNLFLWVAARQRIFPYLLQAPVQGHDVKGSFDKENESKQ